MRDVEEPDINNSPPDHGDTCTSGASGFPDLKLAPLSSTQRSRSYMARYRSSYRRERRFLEPPHTDATPAIEGKHPFDEMLDNVDASLSTAREEEDSYTAFTGPDAELNLFRERSVAPARETDPSQPPPDGYHWTRNGNLAELVANRPGGVTQPQYDFFVDLFLGKDLFANQRWFDAVNAMDEHEYADHCATVRYQVYSGTKDDASKYIEKLKDLPWKAKDAPKPRESQPDRGRFKVEYADVETDKGEMRIGYLTDGRIKIPSAKYALDTSEDTTFANDITFFNLWIGDRHGWNLWMYKSDDEIMLTKGKQIGLLRRIAADLEGALALYGMHRCRCGICNRKLTNDESRARGIGPVCASRWVG